MLKRNDSRRTHFGFLGKQDAYVPYCYHRILSRLREAGWGQELDQMQPPDMERLADLKQVDMATRLGEKGLHFHNYSL